MLTYLLITRARKNDPLPICHATLDVDLLPRLLLDSLVAFALFAPTTPYRSILKGSWERKLDHIPVLFPQLFAVPIAVCTHGPVGTQSLCTELGTMVMTSQTKNRLLTAVVTMVHPLPSHLTQGLGFAFPLAPDLTIESATEYI